ncbi:MAG: hypothetical protein O7A07_07560 [Acidobacteria bacterium]|nr:hypothetical protein [Acidobacteriota bacterium]
MQDRGSNRKGALAVAAVLGLALMAQASARTPPAEKEENPRAAAIDRVTQRFLEAAPDVGETLPADLEVFTSRGEKVQLQSLLYGHVTVLIMGCLT